MTHSQHRNRKQQANQETTAKLSRRVFVSTGSVLAASGIYTTGAPEVTALDNVTSQSVPPSTLAQEFSVAARQTTKDHYMHDPGMAILSDGTLLVAAP